jgi:hypothetical protein
LLCGRGASRQGTPPQLFPQLLTTLDVARSMENVGRGIHEGASYAVTSPSAHALPARRCSPSMPLPRATHTMLHSSKFFRCYMTLTAYCRSEALALIGS